jgi:small subunit ribosomal protein S16
LVKIRLARGGRKKRPFYRVVAADSRMARDGRFLEVLGTYNPISNPKEIKFKNERVEYWLGEGAQMSDTVKNLYKKAKKAEASEA